MDDATGDVFEDDDSAPLTDEMRAKIKPEFLTQRQGKSFVLYAGLLDAAHQEGLDVIDTEMLQFPNDTNGHTAVVKASIHTKRGSFSGIGDANADNVGRMIAMHIIRMAETRAKARALRDAINVGVTSVEELGAQELPNQRRQPAAPRPMQPPQKPTPIRPAMPAAAQIGGVEPASQQQVDRIHKLHAALGMPAPVDAMTMDDAAAKLADLVRRFNAQARDASRAGGK